jgi:hypothetical protein
MVADVAKLKGEAVDEYRQAVDKAEEKRREVLELRQTELWAALFPDETLVSEPNTQSLAGAVRRVQGPCVPGVQTNLPVEGVFALLRADADFCAGAATIAQAAREKGVTPNQLTGREATWQNGQADYFGPPLKATWSGSPEQAEEANKARRYTEWMHHKLHGE